MGDSSTLSLAFYLDPFTSLCWQKQTSLNSIRLVIFFFFLRHIHILGIVTESWPCLPIMFQALLLSSTILLCYILGEHQPASFHHDYLPYSTRQMGGEARVLQHDVRMGKEQEALLKSRLPSEGSRTLWFVCLSFLIKSGEGHRWLQTQAKSPKA